MTISMFLSVAALVGQAATAAPQSLGSGPAVHVGVYGYRADGTMSGWAVDSDPSLESTVWTSGSLCQMGAGHKDLPAMAAHAWRFSGKVISASREEAVVFVEWQRVLDAGKPATAPSGSVQLTLKAGDRVPLDSVLPSSVLCAVTNVMFEARYGPTLIGSDWVKATPMGRAGARSGGGAGGVVTGGGGGVGRGVGVGSGSASGQGAGMAAASRTGEGMLDAEVWLVHNAPGEAERVAHQALRTSPEGALFAFAPMTIETPRGALVVQVSGSFAVTTGAAGAPQLVFVTSRRVSAAQGEPGSRDVVSESGGSRTVHPVPAAGEVLSFEMPPLRLAGWPAIPDKFAVRLRIK